MSHRQFLALVWGFYVRRQRDYVRKNRIGVRTDKGEKP